MCAPIGKYFQKSLERIKDKDEFMMWKDKPNLQLNIVVENMRYAKATID
jgi:hypothetical protein